MALTGSIPVTGSLIVNDVSPRREKKFLRFGGFFFVKKFVWIKNLFYLCAIIHKQSPSKMKSEKEQIAEEIKQAIYRGLKLVETKVEGTSTQIVVNKVESRLAMRFMYFFSTIATSYTKTSEKLQKYRCDIYSYEIQNQIFQVKYYQGYGAYKHYDYCKLVWIKELKNSSRPVGRVKVKVKPEKLIE